MADIYVATTGDDSTGDGSSGNPYASPGKAGEVHSGGDRILVQSGTYAITSTSSNVTGGRVTLTGGSGTALTQLIGYQTVVGDNGTKPVLQASGISSAAICTGTANTAVQNITVDGNNETGIRGFTGFDINWLCKAMNCKNSGFDSGVFYLLCEATGCTTGGSGFQPASGSVLAYCNAHDNSVIGFNGVGTYIHCIADSNSGASTDGFNNAASGQARYIHCTAYGNGRHGFQKQGGGSHCEYSYCVGYGNASNDFDTSESSDGGVLMIMCAGVNVDAQVGRNLGFVTLSAGPFTNAAGGNFAPNDDAGGGADLRGLVPGAFPAGTTTGYGDIGAVQHEDSGGGGGPVFPVGGTMRGGF